MKLVGLFTTTLEMTDSSEASVEFAWVWPRTMFSLTAVGVERGAVGELQSGAEL